MKILHLTDLHFTYDLTAWQSQEKWEKIARDIAAGCEDKKINMVAVTGDFTCHGAKEEFEQAEKFLQDILNALGLKRQQVVMCAGNHDADTDEACSSFAHYQAFCEDFYKNNYGNDDQNTDKSSSGLFCGEKKNFVFVSMNTCCETSLELYERATLQEEDCKQLQDLSGEEIGILLLHHPPETIMNQELFDEVMASGKIQLILSGHQHMSLPRLYKAGEIAVVGGMAITPHRKWMASGCQIVDINESAEVKVMQIDL